MLQTPLVVANTTPTGIFQTFDYLIELLEDYWFSEQVVRTFQGEKETAMPTLFVKNITTVAAHTTLTTAAQTYEFVSFGLYEQYDHCQLCHQRIKHWSAIRNIATGIQLRIGLDCHDKLVHLQATGQLVTIKVHRDYVSQQKAWGRKNLTTSVFAWLKENASSEFAESIRFIDRNGYPPSIAEGEALIAYYRANRYKLNLAKVDFSKFFRGMARVVN